MKYIELFAGIGGFRYGLEQAGEFVCVYANEWNKYAAQVYEKNYEKPDTRDIREVKEIPDHDLLVGGFPCQSFSIAGKRRGFEDTRGTLFFEIARILKAKKPRLFLLENVKGLLSHDSGSTFKTIISTLTELGYDCQWQVLNSKDFGVPQNRERVFIIGHIRGTSRPKVFPITRTNPKALKVRNEVGRVIVRKYPVNIKLLQSELKRRKMTMSKIAKELKEPKTKVEHWFRTDGSFSIPEPQVWLRLKELIGIETDVLDKSMLEFEIRDNKYDMSNRVYEKEGVAPTLTTPTGGHQHSAIDDGFTVRRLTPTECERLQGFPDGWTEKGIDKDGKTVTISDTQRYKVLGNAVTTNVITAIGERLLTS